MKHDDFRYMRRGKQLTGLAEEELELLEPVHHKGKGKESALLVLHGFSSSPAVYRNLIPKIKHYDSIVCPVLPGHAESIEAFSQVKAKDWMATAHQYCEELVRRYKKVDVLGLSLGGLLACELSQHFPVHHLFLLAPALKLNMRINPMLKLAQALKYLGFHHVRNVAGNLLSDKEAEIAYRKLPISTVIEMLRFAKNYEWVPPTCTVDLFLGQHDKVVASSEVEKLFAPMSNVHIHWLKNSAHVLPLDNDLKEIVRCINKQRGESALVHS